MAILSNTALANPSRGYDIEQSLLFDDDDSAYLSRTPGSAGNRRTWTWSGWIKRGNISTDIDVFSAYTVSTNRTTGVAYVGSSDVLYFYNMVGGAGVGEISTSAKFRDPSAWYHVVYAFDSTQSTASNRLKIYINGESQDLTTTTSVVLNSETSINSTVVHSIGTYAGSLAHNFMDGYLAEVNFIDGQALTPASFGKTDLSTNQWVAKRYAGSYGTNGFYLNFSNSGSLGADSSGNNNNFTATNLVAADQKTDTPTNNFATFNRNSSNQGSSGALYYPTYRNGNLMTTNPPMCGDSSFPIPTSGKWYAEFYFNAGSGGPEVGMKNLEGLTEPSIVSNFASYRIYAYTPNTAFVGGKDINNVDTQLVNLSSYYNGGGPYEIQFAYDADNGIFKYYVNGTLVATENSVDTSHQYAFFMRNSWNTGGGTYCVNFGQDSTMHGNVTGGSYTDDNGYGQFKYDPPTGHLALCTANMPDPSIADPTDHFNTVLYTGAGSGPNANTVNTVGFQPDFTWIKNRGDIESHVLQDSVRGVAKFLQSNTTTADQDTGGGDINAFNSDGFILGYTNNRSNATNDTYVAWNWKAGTSFSNDASSTSVGSIDSTGSVNTDIGFSIINYVGSGGNGTYAHGLGVTPEMVMVKDRTDTANWAVYHSAIGTGKYLELNTSDAVTTDSVQFPSVTSTVIGVGVQGDGSITNTNTDNYIAYCFASVDGYSKIGSYIGNGNADGTFVYTGFKPAWVIFRKVPSENWHIKDNKTAPINVMRQVIDPNRTGAEVADANTDLDFLSNGFKMRASHGTSNAGSTEYFYMAFAEQPFKYANGR